MPYFDHNATTPLLPAAREAWLRANDEAWANPSSPYRVSARVHRLLEAARERVAAHLAVAADEIVFVSGATEANNAVIRWAAATLPTGGVAVVSPTEHPSVHVPAQAAFAGRAITPPLEPDGRLAASTVAELRPGIVAAMAANNETGVLGPIEALDVLCRERGAWFLCDAVQWIGRLPGRDLPRSAFLVGSAHKFGGPKGVGFLRVPPAARAAGFRAQLGGEQEHGQRAGTENFPAIAAMVGALDEAEGRLDALESRRAWRGRFIESLGKRVPGVQVNSAGAPGLWNTVSLRMPAHENTRWVVRLDKLGFEVSTGSACATGSSAPSHVLAALGLTADEARRTIRVSSGWDTTERDWQLLADAITNVWEQFEADRGGASVIRV